MFAMFGLLRPPNRSQLAQPRRRSTHVRLGCSGRDRRWYRQAVVTCRRLFRGQHSFTYTRGFAGASRGRQSASRRRAPDRPPTV